MGPVAHACKKNDIKLREENNVGNNVQGCWQQRQGFAQVPADAAPADRQQLLEAAAAVQHGDGHPRVDSPSHGGVAAFPERPDNTWGCTTLPLCAVPRRPPPCPAGAPRPSRGTLTYFLCCRYLMGGHGQVRGVMRQVTLAASPKHFVLTPWTPKILHAVMTLIPQSTMDSAFVLSTALVRQQALHWALGTMCGLF